MGLRVENDKEEGRPYSTNSKKERSLRNMVLANNAIRLREIQANIIGDHDIFHDVNQVSISTLARILTKNQVMMKQIYRVPFERNSERVKQLRHEYVEVCIVHFSTLMLHTFLHVNVLYTKSMLNYTILSFTVFQRVLQMDAEAIPQEYVYIYIYIYR